MTKKKLGGRVGVAEWEKLETSGDIRRFLRWVVHGLRDKTIEKGEAGIFSQLALALLKAVQDDAFEARLRAVEKRLLAAHTTPRAATEEAIIVEP